MTDQLAFLLTLADALIFSRKKINMSKQTPVLLESYKLSGISYFQKINKIQKPLFS